MKLRELLMVVGVAVIVALPARAVAQRATEEESAVEAKASADEVAPGDGDGERKERYHVVTGLCFSLWWMKDLRLAGPNLDFGLVLLPQHLEMTLSFGAMLGDHVYSVPVALTFEVPFRVAKALNLYVDFGPMLFVDKEGGEVAYDFALAMAGGLEVIPPRFDWGIFAQGDYCLRLQQAVRSQGGFSVGFRYRF